VPLDVGVDLTIILPHPSLRPLIKDFLIHPEIGSKGSANCLPQDDTYILNVTYAETKKKNVHITMLIHYVMQKN
jgi:hypothetical protein